MSINGINQTVKMNKKKVELLAPAGSFESLQAAIQARADAIYFGVEQLNMRAKSINSFSIEDMAEIATRCHARNVKCYLTLNTVMYDHDIQLLRTIVQKAKLKCIDGVIASDFAVFDVCRSVGMPLHISTQANVSNYEAVHFFSAFADVVVLARELTLQQVQQITKQIKRDQLTGVSGKPLQIEIFAHGALCMAVSGKCYLSLHAQNASANRGACTQVCRRPYTVTDTETGEELLVDNEYIMSPKDLCTIDMIDQIIAAGVDVLKIEGRGKSADYVYTVTRCYREAIDAIEQGNYSAERIMQWKEELATVYNRGFWEGYYAGRKLGEWTAHPGSAATEKKIYIGKNTRYYPNLQVAEFLVETGTIEPGDTMMVIGNKFGVVKETISEFRVNGEQGSLAIKGDLLTLPFVEKPTLGDKLYKVVQADA
jgi:U32 family peptidase